MSKNKLTSSILNCRFINNTALISGGAIYLEGLGIDILISECLFVNNTADYGRNIYQLTTGA